VRQMRASVLVLGPLVARHSKAKVSLPGGCAIGARPIDQHLKGLAAMGAVIELEHGYVTATAPGGRLRGAVFTFDGQTVTGTENIMMAAAITGGDVLLHNCRLDHMESVAAKLVQAGAAVTAEGQGVRVRAKGPFRACDVTTLPYPGFPTDMQAQYMVLMCLARGESVITETVFENRYMHVPELKRMGADIEIRGRVAVVRGAPKLSGATVMCSDLRASAALAIAGLVAEGETRLLRVYHIDRGYEDIVAKLAGLGADVRRVPGEG
jgi:UDP-N-acetylglucosamine enolpyruvyl transferase